ncbi:MAG: hypothetical protein H6934_14635 [Burkholderiaceae bacterium]|nr:hypothetical protein [Burkholderiaceae bacterium]
MKAFFKQLRAAGGLHKAFDGRRVGGGVLAAVSAAGAVWRPEFALPATAVCLAAIGWAAWHPAAASGFGRAGLPDGGRANPGNSPLVEGVIPVWHRQIEATRALSDKTSGDLLARFSGIYDGLENALAAAEQAASGLSSSGVEEFVREQEIAIQGLMGPLETAVQARASMASLLADVAGEMTDVCSRADEIRALAKRINIVALNASIEATRGDNGLGEDTHAGFAVVASEVRDLAQKSNSASREILSKAQALRESLNRTLNDERAIDASREELRATTEQCARTVIGELLGNLREVGRSGRGLREAGLAVKSEIEQAMVGFQAQDRMSQMLGAVTADIDRLSDWLTQGNPQGDAQVAEWLERLEATYTMEEQRSQHFGHDAIEKQSGVEFF